MNVAESVVIVTGASSGIGWATAVLLAKAGANVVVTARREARLQQLVAEVADYPGKRLAIPGNIQEEAFAYELVDQTVAHFGHVDVLINNAGLGYKGPLATMPSEAARAIMDTNVLGLLYASQAVIPPMKQQGGGQIINVSSIVGQRPLAASAVYCASKTAVNFISRGLRLSLHRHRIIVTLVYPGLTQTEFSEARYGPPSKNPLGLKGVPAAVVGKKIIKAIQKGQTEVYIRWYDWFLVHTSRLFPQATDRLLRLFVRE